MEVEHYGKPIVFNYAFVQESMEAQAKRQNIKISKFYMIGDNPNSDIAGANAKGWVSILVKTGVFDPTSSTSLNGNDKANPATHVVKDF